ncbi:uncharacterized protein [Halyomorpha halys]|uniref:uncharacterized protein n=1 Tax=Halyomorpha halys TaxID=286706 RepID=UPI0006D4ED54|nr:uncharacterized protein LOC106691075 [Halyomorpha halys]
MIPDERKKKCVMCPLTMLDCTCSMETHDYFPGIGCYKKDIVSPFVKSNDIYEISYNFGIILSKLLYEKLLYAVYKCKMNDFISCQLVSNMCVINLYQDYLGGPCRLLREIKKLSNPALPWIYYPEGDAWNVLSKKSINKRFTMDYSSEIQGAF